jgi:hypothetical protein
VLEAARGVELTGMQFIASRAISSVMPVAESACWIVIKMAKEPLNPYL